MLIDYRVSRFRSLEGDYYLSMIPPPDWHGSEGNVLSRRWLLNSAYILGDHDRELADFIDSLRCLQDLFYGTYIYPEGVQDGMKHLECMLCLERDGRIIWYGVMVGGPSGAVLCESLISDGDVVFTRNRDGLRFGDDSVASDIAEACQHIPDNQLLTYYCWRYNLIDRGDALSDTIDFLLRGLKVYPSYESLTLSWLRNYLEKPGRVDSIRKDIACIDEFGFLDRFDRYCQHWLNGSPLPSEDGYAERLAKLYVMKDYVRNLPAGSVLFLGNFLDGIGDRHARECARLFSCREPGREDIQIIVTGRCAGCLMNLGFLENAQLCVIDDMRLQGLDSYQDADKSNRYQLYLEGRL